MYPGTNILYCVLCIVYVLIKSFVARDYENSFIAAKLTNTDWSVEASR